MGELRERVAEIDAQIHQLREHRKDTIRVGQNGCWHMEVLEHEATPARVCVDCGLLERGVIRFGHPTYKELYGEQLLRVEKSEVAKYVLK